MTLEIENSTDLQVFLNHKELVRATNIKIVFLLHDKENEWYSQLINQYKNSSGWLYSSYFLLMAVVGMLICSFLSPSHLFGLWGNLLLLAGSFGIGKICGDAYYKFRLQQTVQIINRKYYFIAL